MSKQALPLATWKTWWTPEQAVLLATSLKNNIDVRRLPRGGCLLDKSDFRSEDLRDPHTATIVEGLLKAYPLDKQPSGYLLGDACLELDRLLNFGIFGDSKGNPIMESKRRDDGLAEGGKLKKLLAFVRTSACKSDVGRTPDVTYLKQLANNRVKRGNARHSALAQAVLLVPNQLEAHRFFHWLICHHCRPVQCLCILVEKTIGIPERKKTL